MFVIVVDQTSYVRVNENGEYNLKSGPIAKFREVLQAHSTAESLKSTKGWKTSVREE